jgi:hypothetical protein
MRLIKRRKQRVEMNHLEIENELNKISIELKLKDHLSMNN